MASKPKLYEVTDQAGAYVAGRRVPKDGILELTDDEAHFDLRAGNIVRHKPEEDEDEAPEKATEKPAAKKAPAK